MKMENVKDRFVDEKSGIEYIKLQMIMINI